MSNFVDLSKILGTEAAELTALKQGEATSDKLGTVPFTALNFEKYKEVKKDCMKMVKTKNKGRLVPEMDEDLLMVKVIIAAVDKDTRSEFSFANKALLDHLGVITAVKAVEALLSPGEILHFATEIQEVSGFTAEEDEELEAEIKN